MPSAFYIMIKMGWTARRKDLNVDQNTLKGVKDEYSKRAS